MGNVITFLAAPVSAPAGLWESILGWIESGVINYGWTIILFTLLIKFAMSPLDFLIKFSTKKSTLVQQKLAPQTARLQKKFGNDQQAYQMQVNALYKREGLNTVGSCLIMLVNLIITMTVFLTIFNGLRVVSAYKTIEQYDKLQTTYTQSMTESLSAKISGVDFTSEEFDLATFLNDETNKTTYAAEITQAKDESKQEILDTWNDAKESWLWIKNIWVADGAKSAMPTYDDLSQLAQSSKRTDYQEYVASLDQNIYTDISSTIQETETSWNGYYVLAIIAALVTFLSQFISQRATKLKNKNVQQIAENPNQNGGMMKFMKILMPVMMVIFVISSSAAFGLYVVVSSMISILLTLLISFFVNLLTKKKEEEVTEYLEKEALKLNRKKNK